MWGTAKNSTATWIFFICENHLRAQRARLVAGMDFIIALSDEILRAVTQLVRNGSNHLRCSFDLEIVPDGSFVQIQHNAVGSRGFRTNKQRAVLLVAE